MRERACRGRQLTAGHIYGGLITVLLRLVFLLYAEDEELMPTDSLYGQHYSVSGLAAAPAAGPR